MLKIFSIQLGTKYYITIPFFRNSSKFHRYTIYIQKISNRLEYRKFPSRRNYYAYRAITFFTSLSLASIDRWIFWRETIGAEINDHFSRGSKRGLEWIESIGNSVVTFTLDRVSVPVALRKRYRSINPGPLSARSSRISISNLRKAI